MFCGWFKGDQKPGSTLNSGVSDACADLSLAKCFVVGLGVAADEDLGFKLCVTALNDDVAQVLVVKC